MRRAVIVILAIVPGPWSCEFASRGGDAGAGADPGMEAAIAVDAADPGPGDPGQEPAGTDVAPYDAPVVPAGDCKPCEVPADCGAGYECSAVGSGKFCLKHCTANVECKAGYVCYPVSTVGKQCLPMSYTCVECAWKGCPQGTTCDLVTGTCADIPPSCGKCTYDFQCGDGARCLKTAQAITGVCVRECPDGVCTDPHFTCGPDQNGIDVCIPWEESYCQPCPPGQVLLGDGKTCVECTMDAHCIAKDPAKPKCDPKTHTCLGPGCGPYEKKCADGKCHECCIDADCPWAGGDPACGCTQEYTCGECGDPCKNAGIDCSTNPYYQACCVINGAPQCCGCATDADCQKRSPDVPGCSCINNMCIVADTMMECQPGCGDCAATCTSDADCPPLASGTGSGSCKLPDGYCYDPSGSCDSAAACCAPCQTCFDLLSLLFGGMGGGIPGMPGTPSSGMTACSCDTDADCVASAPCTSLSDVCVLPLIGSMFCPGGVPPATAPEKLCFDISKLLGGI